MITYHINVDKVFVIPQVGNCTDVINRVVWVVTFFDTDLPEITSGAAVDTILDTTNIDESKFIEFSNLTREQILRFAHAVDNPDLYINRIIDWHSRRLEYLRGTRGEVEKDFSALP